jgi:predicted amidohydrolase YtcJ
LRAEGVLSGFADTEIPGGETCIFHETAVEDIFKSTVLGFSSEEIEGAVLKEQERLIRLGIVEVFSLVFIGAAYFTVLDVLKKLDRQGLIKIKIHYAYTVFPDITERTFCEHVEKSRSYQSDKLIFTGVKLYMDGVIDNHSAVLLRDYDDQPTKGAPMWQDDALSRFLKMAEAQDLAVHIHAIGDGAGHRAATALAACRHPDGGRHMIAHLQLCAPQTMELMAKNDIVACMQPFWFYRGAKALRLDKHRLGDRVEDMYPVRTLMQHGVKVLFSSDCPATVECDPIVGMKVAAHLESKEQITVQEGYRAYYAGSYSEEGVELKVGDAATFLVMDKNLFKKADAKIISVYINAERLI